MKILYFDKQLETLIHSNISGVSKKYSQAIITFLTLTPWVFFEYDKAVWTTIPLLVLFPILLNQIEKWMEKLRWEYPTVLAEGIDQHQQITVNTIILSRFFFYPITTWIWISQSLLEWKWEKCWELLYNWCASSFLLYVLCQCYKDSDKWHKILDTMKDSIKKLLDKIQTRSNPLNA